MSGVQEGEGRSLNLLITLSPDFPSNHSLTLKAACAMAPYRCNQSQQLVATLAPPARRWSAGGRSKPFGPHRSRAFGPPLARWPVGPGLLVLAVAELRGSPLPRLRHPGGFDRHCVGVKGSPEEQKVRGACIRILRRVWACIKVGGSSFQYKLKGTTEYRTWMSEST